MDAGGLVSGRHHHRSGDRLKPKPIASRLLFDGFPHHPAGRGDEDQGVTIDYVLEIDVPDGRSSNPHERTSCIRPGRTYHVKFNPPPKTRAGRRHRRALIQRDDDQEATVLTTG